MSKSKKALCVQGDRIFQNGKFVSGWFLVEQGKISCFGQEGQAPPESAEKLNVSGDSVVPGLVDLHVHGFGGFDATEAGVDKLKKMAKGLAAEGSTSFLATLYPAPVDKLQKQLQAIREAGLLGAHLEGPFVNPSKAGALPPELLLSPDRKLLKKLFKSAPGVIRKMTIAPELPNALEVITEIREHGALASMGHSEATFEEAQKGAAAGARGVTHLFNAMRPLHHREPGLAGYALYDPEISCELIADGIHVSEKMLELVLSRKSSVTLISDGLKGTGLKQKHFESGGHCHEIRSGTAYLEKSKTLSGSCSSLLSSVQKLVHHQVLSLEQAISLSSTNPARELGFQGVYGDLTPGCFANFLILNKHAKLKVVYWHGVALKSLA